MNFISEQQKGNCSLTLIKNSPSQIHFVRWFHKKAFNQSKNFFTDNTALKKYVAIKTNTVLLLELS